jgi:hypothetical protein
MQMTRVMQLWMIDFRFSDFPALAVKYLSDYASLSAAVTAIGATETTLILDADDTVSTTVTIPATLSIQPMKGNVLTYSGAFTWYGPIVGAGNFKFLSQSGSGTLTFGSGAVSEINPCWFGAVPDWNGSTGTDSITAIKTAIIVARATRNATGVQSFTVKYPDGYYYVSTGVPIIKAVNHICNSRWSAKIVTDDSGPVSFTATLSGTTFTDNMDAILGDVTGGSKEADAVKINGIYWDHVGTISGNAPSGSAWTAAVQYIGMPDCDFTDMRVSTITPNYHGFHIKYSWRTKVRNFYTSRGGYTGGIGFYIDSECNSMEVYGPFVYGDWDVSIRSSNPYSVMIIEPHVEAADSGGNVGIIMAGESPRIIGGYFEGCETHIQMGIAGGTAATNFIIDSPWFNAGGSISDYHIDLLNCQGGEVILPRFTGTVGVSEFKSASSSTNKGNYIKLRKSDASTPGLAALGLSGGFNVVEIAATDYADHRASKKWSTSTLLELETELNQRGAALTSFTLEINNNAGTLRHRISSGSTSTTAVFGSKITGASSTYANIASVNSGVDFVSGVGLVSTSLSQVLFDTIEQTSGECFLYAFIGRDQSGATALSAAFEMVSSDINGETLTRPRLQFYDGGSAFTIDSTNLTNGNSIIVNIYGYLK